MKKYLIAMFLIVLITYMMLGIIISRYDKAIYQLEGMLIEARQAAVHYEYLLEELAKTKDKQMIPAVVTAYAPFDNQSGICNDGNPYSTSTGRMPGRLYAAADPERLPYGTRLYIPGYGIVIVQETGGALVKDKENIRIDVFAETYEEAMVWGVQNLEVIILS